MKKKKKQKAKTPCLAAFNRSLMCVCATHTPVDSLPTIHSNIHFTRKTVCERNSCTYFICGKMITWITSYDELSANQKFRWSDCRQKKTHIFFRFIHTYGCRICRRRNYFRNSNWFCAMRILFRIHIENEQQKIFLPPIQTRIYGTQRLFWYTFYCYRWTWMQCYVYLCWCVSCFIFSIHRMMPKWIFGGITFLGMNIYQQQEEENHFEITKKDIFMVCIQNLHANSEWMKWCCYTVNIWIGS